MFPVISDFDTQKAESAAGPADDASAARSRSAGAPDSDARRYVNSLSATVAAIVWVVGGTAAVALGVGLQREEMVPVVLLATVLIGLFMLFSIKVVDQWEKAVVLRFGKFRGLRGPGVFWIIPVVDVISHLVDQRVRATDVTAESALTRDTVPVNVDAIVFWLVWDAQKAVLEVQSYSARSSSPRRPHSARRSGGTTSRRWSRSARSSARSWRRSSTRRRNPWGITVQSVEIRDVRIPSELEDAMSRRAQAERERQRGSSSAPPRPRSPPCSRRRPSSTARTRPRCTSGP